MKNHSLIKSLLIIFISIVSFTFCKKNIFFHVELNGRVINYITKAPIQANIVLWGNDPPGDNYSVNLGNTSTDANGYFLLRTYAAHNPEYNIVVTASPNQPIQQLVKLSNGKNIYIGDVLMGYYTFYCKVTLVSVSGSAIDFNDLGDGAQTHYNAGTDTTITVSKKIDYYLYKTLHDYHISFKNYPNGVPADSSRFIVLPSTPDTLVTTIRY